MWRRRNHGTIFRIYSTTIGGSGSPGCRADEKGGEAGGTGSTTLAKSVDAGPPGGFLSAARASPDGGGSSETQNATTRQTRNNTASRIRDAQAGDRALR